ncbi:hypothetical protein Mp_4g09570 [Marchantia polymorpha subsp. ruderalis]|uniref:Uncharacterized protein n=1 Tax=Marchantia polymorpha subsp. ruderalis TaxID=1480154 RepID=A0AAF6B854_MARPO|nr:hypothetical protein Mp_4g09570 [Marchantia polymorpha subsp. ruderalis]
MSRIVVKKPLKRIAVRSACKGKLNFKLVLSRLLQFSEYNFDVLIPRYSQKDILKTIHVLCIVFLFPLCSVRSKASRSVSSLRDYSSQRHAGICNSETKSTERNLTLACLMHAGPPFPARCPNISPLVQAVRLLRRASSSPG